MKSATVLDDGTFYRWPIVDNVAQEFGGNINVYV
jgi:hypothetical protein